MLTTLHFHGSKARIFPGTKEDEAVVQPLPPMPSVHSAIRTGTPCGVPSQTAIRSGRERLIQTLGLELSGMIIIAPLLVYVADVSMGESLVALIAVSLATMCWTAPFNTVFDRIEYRCAARVASDRPHGWRVVQTVAHEASATLVTCPVIVALTPLGWLEALAADIGLTLIYAAYGYLYHLGFDRLRPVRIDTAPTHQAPRGEVPWAKDQLAINSSTGSLWPDMAPAARRQPQ